MHPPLTTWVILCSLCSLSSARVSSSVSSYPRPPAMMSLMSPLRAVSLSPDASPLPGSPRLEGRQFLELLAFQRRRRSPTWSRLPCGLIGKRGPTKGSPRSFSPTEGLRQPADEDSPAGSQDGSLSGGRIVHARCRSSPSVRTPGQTLFSLFDACQTTITARGRQWGSSGPDATTEGWLLRACSFASEWLNPARSHRLRHRGRQRGLLSRMDGSTRGPVGARPRAAGPQGGAECRTAPVPGNCRTGMAHPQVERVADLADILARQASKIACYSTQRRWKAPGTRVRTYQPHWRYPTRQQSTATLPGNSCRAGRCDPADRARASTWAPCSAVPRQRSIRSIQGSGCASQCGESRSRPACAACVAPHGS